MSVLLLLSFVCGEGCELVRESVRSEGGGRLFECALKFL